MNCNTFIIASSILLASPSFAGGGPHDNIPDFAKSIGYFCESGGTLTGPAKIDIAAPLSFTLSQEQLWTEVGSCKVVLKIERRFLDKELEVLEGTSNCVNGWAQVSHVLNAGVNPIGWYGEWPEQKLGITMNKDLFPNACANDSTPVALFNYN